MNGATTTQTVPGYVSGTWTIDPVHSTIGFTARHMMVSKVRGRFARFSGQIETAPTLGESTVQVEIDMDSVDTGNEYRDNDLRSGNFFEVEAHPTMTYRSTGLTVGDDGIVMDGLLTLKGVSKTVSLAVEIHGFTDHPDLGTMAGFTAVGTLNRRDFGVDFEAPLPGGGAVVADKITIELEIEAVLRSDET